MAARTSRQERRTIAEINVIPLVDIVLVVLIIFMVAAPLVMQPKIDINLPKAATAKEEKDKIRYAWCLVKRAKSISVTRPSASKRLERNLESAMARIQRPRRCSSPTRNRRSRW